MYLVFDVGGTRSQIARSLDGETLLDIVRFPTPAKPAGFISKIVDYSNKYPSVTAVAGGVRGILNEEKSEIHHDHILTAWQHTPLVSDLNETLGVPVMLENDAALAGLGEAVSGAGQEADVMVYHDISTGVGGVKIVSGEIDISGAGFEPGHQVLDIDRTVLGDDIEPTLENLVSGKAVEYRMGTKPVDILQEDVIWDELAGYLAQGLRNSILYWSPEMIVLGGAMMYGSPCIPLETVRKETVRILSDLVPCPYITVGSLKQDAGLYGALALLTK